MKNSKYINVFIERLRSIPPGTVIPKPEAHADFVVKGWGKSAGEDALIYFIPNHSNPTKPHQKGVTITEWAAAYAELVDEQKLSRQWFDAKLKRASDEGGCNFTTIGGIFVLLGEAVYYARGLYEATSLPRKLDPTA